MEAATTGQLVSAAVSGLCVTLAIALATWVASVAKRDVSIVDSVWSLLIAFAALAYAMALPEPAPRTHLLLVLVAVWGGRLAVYITRRNWGEPEDRRYQEIRARNEPNFALKSVYLVFVLQAVLAWIVSAPLLAGMAGPQAMNALDVAGIALFAFGFLFETIADLQLARFKRSPASEGRVLDTGLWRYTRHPNYFGELCVWWGFFLIALAAGGWWSIVSPALMTVLLLKVSGVTLLEKDIGSRRPAYRDYVRRTNAFIPGPPRAAEEAVKR